MLHRAQELCESRGGRPLLFSLVLVFRYIHGDHKDYWERGAQDGHLDFHTALRL